MNQLGQIFPEWFIWIVFSIGYLCCAYLAGKVVSKVMTSLWREARSRDKRIELVSAVVAIIALIVSGGSLLYTVRQVDAVTDRLSALEKAVEAMKAKPEQPKP